jgi:hypothetical protein
VVGKMADGKPTYVMVWPNFSASVNIECRKYLQEAIPSHSLAIAMITDNIMMKIGINLFNKISPTSIPIKVFTTEEKAIEWLKEFDDLKD